MTKNHLIDWPHRYFSAFCFYFFARVSFWVFPPDSSTNSLQTCDSFLLFCQCLQWYFSPGFTTDSWTGSFPSWGLKCTCNPPRVCFVSWVHFWVSSWGSACSTQLSDPSAIKSADWSATRSVSFGSGWPSWGLRWCSARSRSTIKPKVLCKARWVSSRLINCRFRRIQAASTSPWCFEQTLLAGGLISPRKISRLKVFVADLPSMTFVTTRVSCWIRKTFWVDGMAVTQWRLLICVKLAGGLGDRKYLSKL